MRNEAPDCTLVARLFLAALFACSACSGCGSSDSGAAGGAGGAGGSAGGSDAGASPPDSGDSGTSRVNVGHPRNGELPPDFVCPGAPACPVSDDAMLYAGAAVEVTTPEIRAKLLKSAVGKPWEFHPAAGDTFEDPKKSGTFDGTWMAGYDTGRAASGVADDQYARAVVLKQGKTSVALVSIDCIGWFYDEVVRIREGLASAKVDVSYVLVAATHVHETRDTMGIWGPDEGTSGVDKAYNARVRAAAVTAISKAVQALAPANVTFGAIDVDGHLAGTDPLGNGVRAFVGDGRDPVVIDTKMNTMRLARASDKTTIATVVNWAAHPEFAGRRNTLLTSDFVDTLRKGVEAGVDAAPLRKPGVGGVAVFLNGAVGGQIGPGQTIVADPAGKQYQGDSDEQPNRGVQKAKVEGTNLAYYALASLEPGSGAQTFETVRLGVRARQIFARVDNRGYHVAIASRLFDRKPYHFDEAKPIGEGNVPDVLTEIAVVDVGPATMITAPGEMFPESAIGGYDGSHTPKQYDLVQTNPAHCKEPGKTKYRGCNPNPPDLAKAPKGGYLFDLADKEAKYRWLLGLALDELGYIVPAYDYQLDKDNPYFKQPKGDHYEETNSVGPMVENDLVEPIKALLATPVPIKRP